MVITNVLHSSCPGISNPKEENATVINFFLFFQANLGLPNRTMTPSQEWVRQNSKTDITRNLSLNKQFPGSHNAHLASCITAPIGHGTSTAAGAERSQRCRTGLLRWHQGRGSERLRLCRPQKGVRPARRTLPGEVQPSPLPSQPSRGRGYHHRSQPAPVSSASFARATARLGCSSGPLCLLCRSSPAESQLPGTR